MPKLIKQTNNTSLTSIKLPLVNLPSPSPYFDFDIFKDQAKVFHFQIVL